MTSKDVGFFQKVMLPILLMDSEILLPFDNINIFSISLFAALRASQTPQPGSALIYPDYAVLHLH